jgi:hypothetical protein
VTATTDVYTVLADALPSRRDRFGGDEKEGRAIREPGVRGEDAAFD